MKYGPHARNAMDVWLAESDKPKPVLVSIHGDGFRGGNKSVSGDLLRQCLESGSSVVAIAYQYRLFEEVSALPHLTKDDPPARDRTSYLAADCRRSWPQAASIRSPLR